MWCRPGVDRFGGADAVTVQRLISALVSVGSRSSTVCTGTLQRSAPCVLGELHGVCCTW